MEEFSYSIDVIVDGFLDDVNEPSFDIANITCDDVDGENSSVELKEVYYA